MTAVRIPALPGGKAFIRLVYFDSPRDQVIGFDDHDFATESLKINLSSDQIIELIPTADISTTDGRATGYLVTVTAFGSRRWESVIQVPNSSDVQELDVLVSSGRITPEGMKNIFLGGAMIEVVESVPDTELPGILYFVTG